jgi:uncharacterized cupredoxin-like copper-binding protein
MTSKEVSMRRRTMSLPALVLAGFGAVACSDGAADGGDGISTTLTDTAISVATSSAAPGSITFDARNDGTATHELYVFRTDLAPDALPVEDGQVREDADGVEFIAEVEDIAPGTTKPLTVDLDAGSYVLLCNLPGHYQSGMRAAFDVV